MKTTERVLSLLAKHGPMTRSQIKAALPDVADTAARVATYLHADGRVHISGWQTRGIYAIYAFGPGEDARRPLPSERPPRVRKPRARTGRPSDFTPAEDELIEQNYRLGRVIMHALLPAHPWDRIVSRARYLKCKARPGEVVRSPRPTDYTPEENEIIRRLYPEGGAVRCQKALPGRTRQGITTHAQALGVRCREAAPRPPKREPAARPPRIEFGLVPSVFGLGYAMASQSSSRAAKSEPRSEA